MKRKRHRYQIPGVVEKIDDCVRECHGQQAVINLEPVIEDANHDTAYREQKIGVLFREVFVVVKKATVGNDDGVSCEERGKKEEIFFHEKSIKTKIDKNFFFLI